MGQGNSLLENVETIAGEPRMRHLYLTDGQNQAMRDDVASLWNSELGGKVKMYSRESAISSGLFGTDVSLDAAERIGDVIAVAQGDVVLLDPARADQEGSMVGHHGGDSEIESSVPLLTFIAD
jgi:hypothetical protein